jgi:hypothetical protein
MVRGPKNPLPEVICKSKELRKQSIEILYSVTPAAPEAADTSPLISNHTIGDWSDPVARKLQNKPSGFSLNR